MNSKVLLVVILIVIGGLWYLRPTPNVIVEIDSTTNLPPMSREVAEEGDSGTQSENVAIDRRADSSLLDGGVVDPQTKAMIAEWNSSHGYDGLNTNLHSYGSLDNEALIALRESGDVIAATMLARRLRLSQSSEGRDQSIVAHKYAAAMGSSFSMVAIGSDSKTSSGTSENSTQTELDSSSEEGAWYVLAMEHGDPAGYINFKWLIESYAGNIDELIENVCVRRSAAVEQIREIRQELNLSEPEVSLYPGLEGAVVSGELPPIPNCE